MRGNLRTRPLEVLWQVVKYFLVILFVLVVVVGAVLVLLYYKAATRITPDIVAVILGIVRSNLVIIMGILLIPAAVGTWLLTRGAVKSSQLNGLVRLDEQLLDIATDSIFVHDLMAVAFMTMSWQKSSAAAQRMD
ncbi:MAG: hypothetical protein V1809_05860 [Planctomycetota bacterium]